MDGFLPQTNVLQANKQKTLCCSQVYFDHELVSSKL
jgi:hypothetical protein